MESSRTCARRYVWELSIPSDQMRRMTGLSEVKPGPGGPCMPGNWAVAAAGARSSVAGRP